MYSRDARIDVYLRYLRAEGPCNTRERTKLAIEFMRIIRLSLSLYLHVREHITHDARTPLRRFKLTLDLMHVTRASERARA